MAQSIHGKNAELRISTTEAALTSEVMSQIGSSWIYQLAADKRDWKYGVGNTQVTIVYDTVNTIILDDDSAYINYAGGAILLPPAAQGATIDSVTCDFAVSRDLMVVGAVPSCTRSFEVNLSTDIADATCFGNRFKVKKLGIGDWKGSIEGLYVDQDKFDLAVADSAGVQPLPTMRFRADPSQPNTYIQGTVLFPEWSMSGSFDAIVEENLDFEGTGPLDWIKAGVPHFPNEATGP